DWLVREIRLYLRRTFKRLDVTSRSIFALVEPGSCFAGTLLELALAADRIYMLDGARPEDDRPPATIRLDGLNFGAYPTPDRRSPRTVPLGRVALGRVPAADRPLPPREPLPRRARPGGRAPGPAGPRPRRRRRSEGGPRHLRPRRPRLGRRGPASHRGAAGVLP